MSESKRRPTIKDFQTLQGDARRKGWRIDENNSIRIKMTDQEELVQPITQVATLTCVMERKKVSCLTFNGNVLVQRNLFDAKESHLQCAADILNSNLKGGVVASKF
jgi:hypothetical protein